MFTVFFELFNKIFFELQISYFYFDDISIQITINLNTLYKIKNCEHSVNLL